MTWAVVALGLCVLLAACIVVLAHRPRVLHARALRTVIVTTKTGAAYRGCLHESDRDCVVLKSAESLGEQSFPVDGELLLHRADVDTIQIP